MMYGGKYMKNKNRAGSNGPGSKSFGEALSMMEAMMHEKTESAADRRREYGKASGKSGKKSGYNS